MNSPLWKQRRFTTWLAIFTVAFAAVVSFFSLRK